MSRRGRARRAGRAFVLEHRPAPSARPPMVHAIPMGHHTTRVVLLNAVVLEAPSVPAGVGAYVVEHRAVPTDAWQPVAASDGEPLLVAAGESCEVGVTAAPPNAGEFRLRLVEWRCAPYEARALTVRSLAPLLASDAPPLRDAALRALGYVARPAPLRRR